MNSFNLAVCFAPNIIYIKVSKCNDLVQLLKLADSMMLNSLYSTLISACRIACVDLLTAFKISTLMADMFIFLYKKMLCLPCAVTRR